MTTRPRKLTALLTVLGLTLAALCAPVMAQGSRDAGGERGGDQALAKAQKLLRAVAAEKAKLEAENRDLDAEVQKLKERNETLELTLEETRGTLDDSEKSNVRLESRLQRTEDRLARTEDKLRELIDLYKAQSRKLAETEATLAETQDTLAYTEDELADAENKNLTLFKANREMLDAYVGKSGWDGFMQREPFTGLKQVEVENMAQDFLFRIEDERRDSTIDALEQEAREAANADAAVGEASD